MSGAAPAIIQHLQEGNLIKLLHVCVLVGV